MSSWVSSPQASSVRPTNCLPQSTACSAPLSRSTRPGAPIASRMHTPCTRHTHTLHMPYIVAIHAILTTSMHMAMRIVIHVPCTRHAHCSAYAMLHVKPGVRTTVWSRATTMTSRSEAWAIGATSRCCLLRGSRHGGAPTGGEAPLCETSTRTCSSADWSPARYPSA